MSVMVSKLANGLRIVTHAMPHLETVSLGVWVGAGARFEKPNEHGISHLLEHMAFKGTQRRSARDIVEEIESVGGDLNAATSYETTAYYARVLKGDVALALDILADILQHSRFDETELVRERDVILQEIAASEDCPDDVVYDLAQEAAFPDQAVGRSIMGTKQSVPGLTPRDLNAYLTAHYTPETMVLGAAGAVDHDALVKLAEAAFSVAQAGSADKPPPARYSGGLRQGEKAFEQSHIVLAFNSPSYRDDEFYAARVFSSLLGGGMSSRLFQEVREKRGLCYSIYSFCWGLTDTGLFGVHSATSDDQIPELLDVINYEFERAAETVPEPAELDRAKAQLKTRLLTSLESPGRRVEQLAGQLLAFGRPLEIAELTAKVDAVTGECVRAQAKQLFRGGDASIAIAGSQRTAAELASLTEKYKDVAVEAAE